MMMEYGALMNMAVEARKAAYTPYSNFSVGAALLCSDGSVFIGCNIENAAFTPTVCAERTAFFKAVSEGKRAFQAIAIAGGRAGSPPDELVAPCGVCRQVMMEFCNDQTFEIILGDSGENVHVYKLGDILPLGFGPKNLK
jgi:cytidine deaminase